MPEAALGVLVLGGSPALKLSVPITLAIIVLIMFGAVFYSIFEFPSSPEEVDLDTTGPRIVALSILAFVFMASLVFGQPKVRDIFRGVFFWGGLLGVLVVGYTFRGDLVAGGYRVLGALAPGLAVNQDDGTILVVRDTTGHFHINATVNGRPVTFLLDTGASAVVLTYEDAQTGGFSNSDLNFSTPVSTANGRAVVGRTEWFTDVLVVSPRQRRRRAGRRPRLFFG